MAPEARPDLLGLAVSFLVELALRPRYRPAAIGRTVAPAGVQALLAMEVAIQETCAGPASLAPQDFAQNTGCYASYFVKSSESHLG